MNYNEYLVAYQGKRSIFRLLRACLGISILLSIVGVAGYANGQPAISFQVQPFELKQVRLLESPFQQAMERDRRYLHELDLDRLLHNFRVNAGLPSTAEPLGGWEKPDCEVRGHTVGHYLTACALMVASTGDEDLKTKVLTLVSELAKCQKALGENGYLSAFPESFIDRVEACKPVWAPYYTLHKILNGLLDVYLECGSEQALDVATRMAAWFKMRSDRLLREQMQTILQNTEQGGMNDALTKLFSITGNPDHLALARTFDEDFYTEPLSRREDRLKGQHVNSFIPNMIGSAREYEMIGDETARDIASFFWDQVTGHRCYATGGTSNFESWRTDPDVLAEELSPNTQETCCQYNMLKLTRHLFTWNPDPKYADYYERTLYNSILPTQEPETGMMMYYVPLISGHFKVFSTPNDSFWCCVGTGIENHAKYGDSIYFHNQQDLYVNLFIASELTWKEKGLILRQETRFPEQDRTSFTLQLQNPAELNFRIRVPYWATQGISVVINGEKQESTAEPSSYLSLRRTWKDGDRIEVQFPMNLHLQPMPDDPNLVAILFGPLVLVGELGKEQFTREMQDVKEPNDRFQTASIPIPRLAVNDRDPNHWLTSVDGQSLTFRTQGMGQPNDVTLIPFYRLFGQRYAVYWPLRTQEEWAAIDKKQKALKTMQDLRDKSLQERIVDSVAIGNPESEQQHRFQSKNSQNGTHMDKAWRHATGDGWFSYEMKVLPDQPMYLHCTYWGEDDGRTFDILVNDQVVFQETLHFNCKGQFFDREYAIPFPLTEGLEKVTVQFRCDEQKTAGGVFECAILKRK